MLQIEIEQKAKEKVLSEIKNLPQFTHKFFIENESTTFTTKRGYCGILHHFLCYVKELHAIDNILNISINTLENLSLEDIKQYENILSNEFSESTVKSRLNSLKGVFKFLYYNQIISKNVMSQVIIDNKRKPTQTTDDNALSSLFVEVSHIGNNFLRKRNLCILSIIVDTGLSIQDIVELNVSNVANNQIVFENQNGVIRYTLYEDTIKYLQDYLNIIDTTDVNRSLFSSTMNERISVSVIKNIFKHYGKDILPSHFQAKPKVTIKDSHDYTLIIERNKNIKPSITEIFSMELLIEPYYRKDSCVIDTNKSFTKSFDYEVAYNNTYCFKVGFNLYSTDKDYEDKKDIVATVEGQFFKYNRIDEYGIDVIDLADTVSNDVLKAIQTLTDNFLFTEVDMEYMPMVCYLSRLYIYPEYRGNGIATYIYENLQEIFEYVTSDLTSIFITLPCPQEPTSNGKWENIKNDSMFKKMVRLLDKHDFKPIGNDGFYYKLYT